MKDIASPILASFLIGVALLGRPAPHTPAANDDAAMQVVSETTSASTTPASTAGGSDAFDPPAVVSFETKKATDFSVADGDALPSQVHGDAPYAIGTSVPAYGGTSESISHGQHASQYIPPPAPQPVAAYRAPACPGGQCYAPRQYAAPARTYQPMRRPLIPWRRR